MVFKLFKKYYNKKCTHNNFSMPKTILKLHQMAEPKATEKLKAKGSIFGTYSYT